MRICSVKGCKGKHYAKGLCKKHYHKFPEVKEYQRVYHQRPEVKEKKRVYQRRPEVKEYQRVYQRRPEVKEKTRELDKNRGFKKLVIRLGKEGFSDKVREALVLDGEVLDSELKKRGVTS